MNRGAIINMVFQQCRNQSVNGGLGELLIQSMDGYPNAKRRSVFIAGTDQNSLTEIAQHANDHLRAHNQDEQYTATTLWHGTVDQPSYSIDEIPLSDNHLENNWRCRLVTPTQINFAEEHQFYNLIMKATWRIIVTRRNGDYFVRKDIYPFIWSSGYSAVGFPELEEQVQHELEFFNNYDVRAIDELNDCVKGFAANHGENFHDVIGDGFTIGELRADFPRRLQEVLDGFRHYFP